MVCVLVSLHYNRGHIMHREYFSDKTAFCDVVHVGDESANICSYVTVVLIASFPIGSHRLSQL